MTDHASISAFSSYFIHLKSIEHLSGELLKENQGRGDSMEQTTKDMVALFKRSLQLFAECHNIYNRRL